MGRRWCRDTLIFLVVLAALLVGANVVVSYYLYVQSRPGLGETEHLENRAEWAYARFQDARAQEWLNAYGPEVLERVYPGKTRDEVEGLLRTHSGIRFVYEPFAEHRHPRISDHDLHVHDEGFRLIGRDQGPWPPDPDAVNVYVFGGSTTFGGSVSDHETIPAHLQAALRSSRGNENINVYNFGVGSYFSSQEVTLFQNKLRAGYVPDVVVFIDGLNDFHFWQGESDVAKVYRSAYRAVQQDATDNLGKNDFLSQLSRLWDAVPMVKLARRLATARSVGRDVPQGRTAIDVATPERLPNLIASRLQHTEDEVLESVISRYIANTRIAEGIAENFGIVPVFVWQPVPTYNYSSVLHPYAIPNEHLRSGLGYPRVERLRDDNKVPRNFIWCADVFKDTPSPKYVDSVHYTNAGNAEVAKCISRGMTREKYDTPRLNPISARRER